MNTSHYSVNLNKKNQMNDKNFDNMKNNYICEIFNELYSKFAEINDKYYQLYKETFKVMYNKDRDFTSDVSNNIIYYFIEHYIKETQIIVKDSKLMLSETVYNKFYNYLYTLGLDVPRYKKDYRPKKSIYLIKHVISTFIIENKIDLSTYTHRFENLYSKGIKNYSIDIVNYFIHISDRPWKAFCDYMNEFMDYFETLDNDYARPEIINMEFEDVDDLVNQLYSKDISSKPTEVRKLYYDMWLNLYGNEHDNQVNEVDMKYMVIRYFVAEHYKTWKTKYNYEKEWKDYIETLNID